MENSLGSLMIWSSYSQVHRPLINATQKSISILQCLQKMWSKGHNNGDCLQQITVQWLYCSGLEVQIPLNNFQNGCMLGNVKSSLAGRSVAAVSSQVPIYLLCCSLIIDIRFWRRKSAKKKVSCKTGQHFDMFSTAKGTVHHRRISWQSPRLHLLCLFYLGIWK